MTSINMMSTLLGAIGLFTTVSALISGFFLIKTYIRSSGLSRYAHLSRDGRPPWAMVTGASEGVGLALAEELAAQGFNVVLHGRNQEKLSRIVVGLRRSFPQRSFKIIIADANKVACVSCLGTSGSGGGGGAGAAPSLDFAAIRKELDGIDLSVLINSAGGGGLTGPPFVPFKDKPEVTVAENVSINALFPLHLTRALLPNLLQNAPALLINIGAMSDQGLPLITTYSASKLFLMGLTESIRREMMLDGRADDVEVLGIRTGRVTGVGQYKEPPSFFVPDAKTFARAVLAHAGHGGGVVVGYWTHMLQQLMSDLQPLWLADRVMVYVMRANSEAWELEANKDA